MPLHLAQMNELQTQSSDTWKALKEGDFCVKKTGTPFSNLFVNQTLEQERLKTYRTWMKKATIAGDEVVKLREDRQLLARFLVIQQSRPQLVDKLTKTIGKYEMAVTR